MTEEKLYQKIFASHFGQLSNHFLMDLWESISTLHGKETLNNGDKILFTFVLLLMLFGIHTLVNPQLKHLHVVALPRL
jgi:hypothetical protein